MCLVVGLAVQGCGSGPDENAQTVNAASPESQTSTSSPPTPSPEAATGSCVDVATAIVEEAKAPLSLGAMPELDMSSLAGRNVWHIAPSLALGFTLEYTEGVERAGEAAGLEIEVWDSQGDPTRMAEGVTRAVSSGADAIVMHAIDPAIVSQQLADAEEAGIPVLSVLNGIGEDALPQGISGTFDPDIDALGRMQAAYALMDGDCDIDTAVFYSSTFPILVKMKDALRASLDEMCPDCSVSEETVDVRTMSQKLPSQTQNLLRRSEDLTHIISTFDAAALFIAQGIGELESDVEIVSVNGTPANLDMMREGDVQIADAAYPPGEVVAWQTIDQIARLMSGENYAFQPFLIRMLDDSNLGPENTLESLFPGIADYQSVYMEAWGL